MCRIHQFTGVFMACDAGVSFAIIGICVTIGTTDPGIVVCSGKYRKKLDIVFFIPSNFSRSMTGNTGQAVIRIAADTTVAGIHAALIMCMAFKTGEKTGICRIRMAGSTRFPPAFVSPGKNLEK